MKNLKTVLVHLALWVGYFNLLAWSFSSFDEWQAAAQRAMVMVGIHSVLFYLNADVLMPRLLERGRSIWYALALLFSMGLVLLFLVGPAQSLLPEPRRWHPIDKFENRTPRMQKSGEDDSVIRDQKVRKRRWIEPRSFGILVSSTIALFLSAIYFNVRNKKIKDQEWLQLQNESLEAEQKFLKSQINPHFLFNTLNNLYSLATMKSDKTAGAIQELSEILRYSIYDSQNQLVSLSKEVEYIQHYIKLQLLKDQGFEDKIAVEISGPIDQVQIPPMLLLPFVENAFKHGDLAASPAAFINVIVQATDHGVSFVCENSVGAENLSKDKTTGIGMKNVERRLELYYGNRYDLTIDQGNGKFKTILQLTV